MIAILYSPVIIIIAVVIFPVYRGLFKAPS